MDNRKGRHRSNSYGLGRELRREGSRNGRKKKHRKLTYDPLKLKEMQAKLQEKGG